jgi:hypothetical protein
MALNKVAAAYLAYFAYIDDAQETVLASDFVKFLGTKVPAGAANGPWKLCWGPAVNDGILGYVAQGADGTYALAFRGTDVDGSVSGSIQNLIADANGFLVAWLYPQQPGAPLPLQISAGINGALALVIGLTDPATDVSLLDYLRGLAKSGPLDLMVTGHSLGAAIAVAATAWLYDQLPKLEPLKFSLWPHTFAAPTMWNAAFATMFAKTFAYYAAVNANDVVPMGWANLKGVLATYPSPGPSLYDTDYWLGYFPIWSVGQILPTYTEITPSNADSFTVPLIKTKYWTDEAGAMHSMQLVYFPHATGTVAPPLPGVTQTGLARTRIAAPA